MQARARRSRRTAAALVAPGSAVLLGPGRTTWPWRDAWPGRPADRRDELRPGHQALSGAAQIDVVMVGGTLRRSIGALVGPITEQNLQGLRGAQVFLSGEGVTVERGLTTPNVFAAATDQAFAAAARQVVVLADHTKLGQDTMCQTVPTERIDVLVTDARRDPMAIRRLTLAGVDVQVAARLTVSHRIRELAEVLTTFDEMRLGSLSSCQSISVLGTCAPRCRSGRRPSCPCEGSPPMLRLRRPPRPGGDHLSVAVLAARLHQAPASEGTPSCRHLRSATGPGDSRRRRLHGREVQRRRARSWTSRRSPSASPSRRRKPTRSGSPRRSRSRTRRPSAASSSSPPTPSPISTRRSPTSRA